MGRTEIIETLQSSLPSLRERYRIRSLKLFGSFGRDDAGNDSDVDLLVEFEPGADLIDLSGAASYLEERLNRKVDLVTPAALKKEMKPQIMKDSIAI